MTLDEFVRNFAHFAGDPISIAYRSWSEPHVRVIWVNPAFTELFGFRADEIIGQPVEEMIHPIKDDPALAEVKARFDAGDTSVQVETVTRTKAGEDKWVSISACAVEASDGRGRFGAAIYRDLTQLKDREIKAQNALRDHARLLEDARAAERRLISAINAMPDPVAIWDNEFRMVICNEAFAPRLLGRKGAVAPGTALAEVLKEAAWSGQFVEALGREDAWWHEAEAALRSGPIRDRTEYTDGRILRANSHKSPDQDTIVVTMDVTELEEQKRSLEVAHNDMRHQAMHDDLTGLGNRRMLTHRLSHLLSGGDQAIAVLQIDLDRFKNINDTIGHAAGDHVLAETANRLRGAVANGELVARIGGDEFVVLIASPDSTDRAEVLAEKLIFALSRPIDFEGASLRVGASIGVAHTPFSKAEDLLTNADIALYKAKSQGRGRISRFEMIDKTRLTQQKALADDVLRAIEQAEFVPVFQPQVDATTGAVVALEVLARWAHPTRGILAPGSFMRAADDLSVLHEIDSMIFDKALGMCSDVFQASEQAPGLAFNVSQQRLMNPLILEDAKRSSSYAGHVTFELLETIYFEGETDAFLMQIDAVRDLGVAIEIDDFGSGRASIVALQRIAPERLKIDRELVLPVVRSDESRKLVRSIVDIGKALGIGITAEGVETAAHAEILAAFGCDRLQGFHYSVPVPLEQILERYWPQLMRQPRSCQTG